MSKLIIILMCLGVITAVTPQLRTITGPGRRPLIPPPRVSTPIFTRPSPSIVVRSGEPVYITRQIQEDDGNGSYNWAFQNSDGTEAEQRGYIKNPGSPNNQIQVMEGSYTYYDTLGKLVRVRYIADEGGFRILEDTRLY